MISAQTGDSTEPIESLTDLTATDWISAGAVLVGSIIVGLASPPYYPLSPHRTVTVFRVPLSMVAFTAATSSGVAGPSRITSITSSPSEKS